MRKTRETTLKDKVINQLIKRGIFKIKGKQLYEAQLKDLITEYDTNMDEVNYQ